MHSETLQLAVIDDRTLQQLKDEIKQEMCDMINKANFSQILAKHGILREEVLQFEYRIDLDKLQSSDSEEDNEKSEKFLLQGFEDCSTCTCTCWARNLRKWIPCPCTGT